MNSHVASWSCEENKLLHRTCLLELYGLYRKLGNAVIGLAPVLRHENMVGMQIDSDKDQKVRYFLKE